MKKLFYTGIVALCFALVGVYVSAQTDGIGWFNRINWAFNGAMNFVQRVNSSGQLVIYNNGTGDNSLAIDDGEGAVYLRTRTTAQLGALAPSAANGLIINSTANALCISTGTGQGAWVYISSTSANATRSCI